MNLGRQLLFERKRWKLLILAVALTSATLGLTGPLYQKSFIDSLAMVNGAPSFSKGLWDLLYFFVCFIGSLAFQLLASYLGQREALVIQKNLSEKIYSHMLRLKSDRLKNTQVGEIVSLYAIDAAGSGAWMELAWTMGAITIFPLVLAPFMLRQLLNIPLTPLLIAMGFSVAFMFFLSWRQSRFFKTFKRLAAERTGIVNEWVQNIRALKALDWVVAFEEKIFKKRVEETNNRIAMVSNGQTMATLGASLGFILNLVGIFALLRYRPEGSLTPGELTATLWALGVFLTRYLRGIPWILTFSMDSYTSILRVEKFLNLKSESLRVLDGDPSLHAEENVLKVKNLSLTVDGKSLLKDVSIEIKKPQLIGIVGSVGSGKTLFIQSLLGEVPAQFERYRIHGKNVAMMPEMDLRKKYSLVPQDAFTASSSIQNNILLDYEIPAEQVQVAREQALANLERAHFSLEAEGFSEGIDTLLGERGINLSGGQRQRLGLARALYADRPILILDDALSAVDVNTEQAMITSLFRKLWKDKVIFFVTHRHLSLPLMDRVLFFKDGKLEADGSYQNLVERSPEFKKFILEDKSKKGDKHELLS